MICTFTNFIGAKTNAALMWLQIAQASRMAVEVRYEGLWSSRNAVSISSERTMNRLP